MGWFLHNGFAVLLLLGELQFPYLLGLLQIIIIKFITPSAWALSDVCSDKIKIVDAPSLHRYPSLHT